MELDKLLDYVEEQQNKIIAGIPLNFNRYNFILPSIEKGDSWLIMGGSGSGKSAFAIDKMFIDPLLFAYKNQSLMDIHIDYFNLEETEIRHSLRVLSNMAYKLLNVEYSIKDFLNKGGNKPLLNKTAQFKPLQSFNDFVNLKSNSYTDSSPSLIKKRILESVKALKARGVNTKADNFYHLVIIDNLKFLKKDNGHNTRKDVIDDLCLNILQDLRLKEHIIPIVLQHQSGGNDNVVVNIKGDLIDNKLKPSLWNLGDSLDTQTPSTNIIGLFKPHRFGIEVYPKGGYNIKQLQDNVRFLIPLKLRDDPYEGLDLAIYFKGNVSAIEELPPVADFIANPKLYDKYSTVIPTQQKPKFTITT